MVLKLPKFRRYQGTFYIPTNLRDTPSSRNDHSKEPHAKDSRGVAGISRHRWRQTDVSGLTTLSVPRHIRLRPETTDEMFSSTPEETTLPAVNITNDKISSRPFVAISANFFTAEIEYYHHSWSDNPVDVGGPLSPAWNAVGERSSATATTPARTASHPKLNAPTKLTETIRRLGGRLLGATLAARYQIRLCAQHRLQ